MKNQHCLSIGINRYQFFQHLSFADADAQAVRKFLIEEAQWDSENCLLLTDTSPPRTIQKYSDNGLLTQAETINTYPTQHNIVETIQELLKKSVQPGDSFWFFFSGYGACADNEDYLMPIDGNPEKVKETGIPISWLFSQLAQIGKKVLVLLDINRSQGITGEQIVGYYTIQLAQKYSIPVLLSCQLDQFSHEAPALNHGLFTAGLLEALRYDQEITVSSLDWYLRTRLPELSEHHWLPIQIPLTVTTSPSSEDRYILQLNSGEPLFNNINSALTLTQEPESSSVHDQILASLTSITAPPDTQNQFNNYDSNHISVSSWQSDLTPPVETNGNIVPSSSILQPEPSPPSSVQPKKPIEEKVPEENSLEDEKDDIPLWKKLIFWGTGATLILIMIIGVFVKNQKAFTGAKNNQVPLNGKQEATSNNKPQGDSKGKQANQVKPSNSNPSPSPQKQPVSTSSSAPLSNNEQLAKSGKILLDAASAIISKNEPSSYQKAIILAQRIAPEEPEFMNARKSIDNWQQKIYEIAQNLAKKGDYQSAIKTARLITEDAPIYKQVEKSMNQWKNQKQVNPPAIKTRKTTKVRKPAQIKNSNQPQKQSTEEPRKKAGQLKPQKP